MARPLRLLGRVSGAEALEKPTAGTFHGAAQQQAINDADDARCRQYGAKPGTDAYIACRVDVAKTREAADEAQREAWLGVAPTAPPAPKPSLPQDHVCIAANNTLYRC